MDNERRTPTDRPGSSGPEADRSETARDINRTMPPATPPAPGSDRAESMRQAPRTAGAGDAAPLSESPRATATRDDGAQPDRGGTTPPTGLGRPATGNASVTPAAGTTSPAGAPSAAGTTPSDPGHMEGASGLGTGAERPGAVSAGYPKTVAHTGPAPEAEATPRPTSPRPDVTTANLSDNPSAGRDTAKSNGIGGKSWTTWGLIALAVLVVLWIIF